MDPDLADAPPRATATVDPEPQLIVLCSESIMKLGPSAILVDIIQIVGSPYNATPQTEISATARLIHKSGAATPPVAFLIEPSRNMKSTFKGDLSMIRRSVLSTVTFSISAFNLVGLPIGEFTKLLLDFKNAPVRGHIAISGFRATFFGVG